MAERPAPAGPVSRVDAGVQWLIPLIISSDEAQLGRLELLSQLTLLYIVLMN